MGAVLVHIDLDGERPHPSSQAALAAGRAVASSWGATLYAAIIVHDPNEGATTDTGRISSGRLSVVETVRAELASGGADKVVAAISDAPVGPLWAAVGGAWQRVLDQLRPRLVLFGSDAPSAAELGARTGARIGARLLTRARAVGLDDVELRDRDGGYVRATDGGAAVVMIGGSRVASPGDDDIDLVVVGAIGAADTRIELGERAPAELAHTRGAIVVLDDEHAADPKVVGHARRLASLLGAPLVGGRAAVRAKAIEPSAVIERGAALAPELCVAIGTPAIDLAGAASLVRIGGQAGKPSDGALAGRADTVLAELIRVLEAR
ncbi:MAG: hypothetical protein H6Q90_1113 [Deltaproteobacteria bacterium]|nr:hypothetical protein [Deltaproteobacteria bacterium]